MGRRTERTVERQLGARPKISKYAAKQERLREEAREKANAAVQVQETSAVPSPAIQHQAQQSFPSAVNGGWRRAKIASNYRDGFTYAKVEVDGRIAHVPEDVLMMAPDLAPGLPVLVLLNYGVPPGYQPRVLKIRASS